MHTIIEYFNVWNLPQAICKFCTAKRVFEVRSIFPRSFVTVETKSAVINFFSFWILQQWYKFLNEPPSTFFSWFFPSFQFIPLFMCIRTCSLVQHGTFGFRSRIFQPARHRFMRWQLHKSPRVHRSSRGTARISSWWLHTIGALFHDRASTCEWPMLSCLNYNVGDPDGRFLARWQRSAADGWPYNDVRQSEWRAWVRSVCESRKQNVLSTWVRLRTQSEVAVGFQNTRLPRFKETFSNLYACRIRGSTTDYSPEGTIDCRSRSVTDGTATSFQPNIKMPKCIRPPVACMHYMRMT